MTAITIDEKTSVLYPEEELKDLKKCKKLQGFLLQCAKTTGISTVTISKIAAEGTGQKMKVDAIRTYVSAFIAQMKKPIAQKKTA